MEDKHSPKQQQEQQQKTTLSSLAHPASMCINSIEKIKTICVYILGNIPSSACY